MLRSYESMFNSQSGAEINDGPYVTLGDANYKIWREYEHYPQVVHYSRILCRLPDESRGLVPFS